VERAAVSTDPIVLITTIGGPTVVPPESTCEYVATTTRGSDPFSYEWLKDGALVGTGSSVLINVGTPTFCLR